MQEILKVLACVGIACAVGKVGASFIVDEIAASVDKMSANKAVIVAVLSVVVLMFAIAFLCGCVLILWK